MYKVNESEHILFRPRENGTPSPSGKDNSGWALILFVPVAKQTQFPPG